MKHMMKETKIASPNAFIQEITLGFVLANVVYKNKNKPKINIVMQNLTILG